MPGRCRRSAGRPRDGARHADENVQAPAAPRRTTSTRSPARKSSIRASRVAVGPEVDMSASDPHDHFDAAGRRCGVCEQCDPSAEALRAHGRGAGLRPRREPRCEQRAPDDEQEGPAGDERHHCSCGPEPEWDRMADRGAEDGGDRKNSRSGSSTRTPHQETAHREVAGRGSGGWTLHVRRTGGKLRKRRHELRLAHDRFGLGERERPRRRVSVPEPRRSRGATTSPSARRSRRPPP